MLSYVRAVPFLAALSLVLGPTLGEAAPSAASVVTRERSVSDAAPGVHVIRHRDAPDTNPQGNTVVVIGERDVMVIDAGYLPSSAREDIAQIMTWTRKPVRYLVNTHWHPDHVRGNAAYREAFPGIAIVAHPKTLELQKGFDEPNLVRYRARVAALRQRLAAGKGEDGAPLGEAERRGAAADLARRTPVALEFERYVPAYPQVLVARDTTIDLGDRVVVLRCLGPGHTVGDLVAHLPAERVLIAGDIVAYPVPYFFAGWPYGLMSVLEGIQAMDLRAIVPGHGPVLRDKAYVAAMLDLLRDTREKVVGEVRRRGSLSAKLEDVRKTIDFSAAEKRFAGDDKDNVEFFRESMDGLVNSLFHQIDM